MTAPTPIANHGGYWRCSWYDDAGERRWKCFGRASKVKQADAHAAYVAWLVRWQTDDTVGNPGVERFTVAKLVTRYLAWADTYYRRPDGTLTGETTNLLLATRHLREHCDDLPADRVTPRVVKEMREAMIASGRLSRCEINDRIARIRRMFKWAVSEELVPSSVWHAMQTIEPLKRGRTLAHESRPVAPVPDASVDAVVPLVPAPVSAMIRIQRLTGMRPGEVCIMRGCDIDMNGPVWMYRPHRHKTEHHGRDRVIAIGPQAQAIIRPYLVPDTTAYLFRSEHHKASLPCYTRNAYLYAIYRACDRAGIARWSPNRLRHARATELRKQYGLEATKAILGHSKVETTQIYAEADYERARTVMAQVG